MPMRPDVALIAPYPPAGERHGGHSGVASYTANLAHGLAAAGLDVEVVAPELDGDPASSPTGRSASAAPTRWAAAPCRRRSRAAAERSPGVVHLQFELFLYGGPSSLVGLVPALGRARRTLGDAPLVTTMHQVVEPSTIDRRYTKLHRVSAPAVVARGGIAGVQAAVTPDERGDDRPRGRRSGASCRAPTSSPTASRSRRRSTVTWPAARSGSTTASSCCASASSPRTRGSSSSSRPHPRCHRRVHVVVAGGEHPRMDGGDELRRRAARPATATHATFTGWVPDGDVANWFAAADLAVFPYPKPFAAVGRPRPRPRPPHAGAAVARPGPVRRGAEHARLPDGARRRSPRASTALVDRPGPARRARVAGAPCSPPAARGRPSPAQHARLYEEVRDVDRHTRRRLRAG